jgi:hypothetical protein
VGDGPRSAFEYGAVQRVLVPMSRVRSGLNLRQKS